ncbi:Phospholipase D beta 1, partial [Mucuna pruriens]
MAVIKRFGYGSWIVEGLATLEQKDQQKMESPIDFYKHLVEKMMKEQKLFIEDKGSNHQILGKLTRSDETNSWSLRILASLGMIVDEEYVMLEYVNINQHSVEGTRDIKLAMGA